VNRLVVRRAVDIVLEIRQHLEVLADIRVERRQQVIEQPVAKQDDLDVERDWIGLQRHRVRDPDEPADVLDLDLALAQRSLQGRPAERLHQQVPHVEH